MPRVLKTLKEKLVALYIPEANTGCWLWLGCRNKLGYGLLRIDSHRQRFAHRLAYQVFVGGVPSDRCVCHKCDTPGCINPDHLYIGTMKDNIRDMYQRNRMARKRNDGTPYRNWHFSKKINRFRVVIDGRQLGTFKTQEEAQERAVRELRKIGRTVTAIGRGMADPQASGFPREPGN